MVQYQFPDNFYWGVATASYQIEGGVNEGGRGDTIWDAFARTPGKCYKGQTGDVAVDHYHRYKEDVRLMKNLGFKTYRFSIAWARIIPAGIGEVNEEGVKFYNNLIDELLANGIQPLVTLYHWDLPLALQTEYDGWLGGEITQRAFVEYARVCFERFGDRVKTWITFNEPWCITYLGHGFGEHAPGRVYRKHLDPYISGHNILLAHAKAVNLYRRDYQKKQGGVIALTCNSRFFEPKATDDEEKKKQNEDAAERGLAFELGWFMDPVYFGDYPEVMKKQCGDRLPSFTKEEKELLKGSNDFFGLNHYNSSYAEPSEDYLKGLRPPNDAEKGGWQVDMAVHDTEDPSWSRTEMGYCSVPWGFKRLLLYVQKKYNPKGGIHVTENGTAVADVTREDAQNDDKRVNFFQDYIGNMKEAMDEGADVRGYVAWTLLDNFEWSHGFRARFGLYWVDFDNNLERVPKKSALWFKDLIQANGF